MNLKELVLKFKSSLKTRWWTQSFNKTDSDVLNKIPKKNVDGFDLWRLGVFRTPEENQPASFELVMLTQGQVQPPHHHNESDAKLYFVLGHGEIKLNGKMIIYKPGDVFDVPRGTIHAFKAQSESLFLSIQRPPIRDQITGREDFINDNQGGF